MGWCASNERPGREEERRPTDVFWLILFFLFIALMIFIGAFALVFGDPLRLVNGYDSFGNVCGSDNSELSLEDHEGLHFYGYDATDLKYVFFFNVSNLEESLKLCVKKCPDRRLDTLEDIHKFYNRTGSKLCRYDYDDYETNVSTKSMSLEQYELLRLNTSCPGTPVYKSVAVLNRCVPENSDPRPEVLYNLYAYLNSMDVLEQVLADLYASWDLILTFIFITLGLSCVLMLCLHYITSLVCYIIMIGVSCAAVVSTILLWWGYATVHLQLDNSPLNQILEESARNERALLTYAIIATIFTAILIFLVMYVRRHVDMVSELFKHAGTCLKRHPALLLQPVITFFVLLAFFTLWVWVMASLATAKTLSSYRLHSGLPVDRTKGITPLSVLEYDKPVWVRSMWWVWLVGLVWVAEFILACQQMIIASAVSTYYFGNQEGRRDGRHPVWWSWRILLLYHLGTVAKGSLLITVFKLPRLILQWITKKCKDPEHKCGSCCLRLCCCCLWIFEHFLKYMNHNAYTVTATRGTAFCESARIAWRVVFTNMLQVATVNSVGDLTIFLAKVTVTAVVCCIALPVMAHDPTLHLYAVPLLLTAVFAFFITHCVFSVYEMAVDTLFLCFSDDYNTYDSTDGRELVANKDLYEFMVKHEDIDRKKSPRKPRSREPPETIRFNDGLV